MVVIATTHSLTKRKFCFVSPKSEDITHCAHTIINYFAGKKKIGRRLKL